MKILLLIIISLIVFCIGEGIGQYLSDQYWQTRLVEEQLAEWRVDPATGKVWFKTYAWEDVEQ